MIRVGLVSDTHGWWDEEVEEFFAECDTLLHAGDIGTLALADQIAAFRPLVAVYGNIDGADVRSVYPKEQVVELEGLRIYMTHIGGWPRHYAPGIARRLADVRPGLFVAGHSHILRVMHDAAREVLYINPGAYGRTGFHTLRTAIRLEIDQGVPRNLEVLNLAR